MNVVFSNLQRKPELAGNEDFAALGALVSSLGTLASFELKGRIKAPASFDLSDVFEMFLIVVRPAWDESGGSIELDVPSGLPAVRGEPNELLQVLLNLSSNSLRAVADFSDKVFRVAVSINSAASLLRIRVCDSGPGVTNPEVLFHAFQPGAQSAGLGLYVARALMRNVGGELHYEDSPAGAGFVIEMLAT